MPHNRGTRRNPRYVGVVSYKGHTKWVGTHRSVAGYKQAEHERLTELRDEIDRAGRQRVPTVLEFAGAAEREDGRVTMIWPEGQRARKETGRRACSVKRMREGLMPFVREFGDRKLDSFTRQEALTWALPRSRHVQQAVGQFFNHALDRDLIARNVFARLGSRRRARRIEQPGFEIITNDQYQRLRRSARASRTDSYGLILEGVILTIGETAMRPGEIFALHHSDIDHLSGLIHVRRQLDMASGIIGWPKDDEPREIVMSSPLQAHLMTMPRISETIVFPTPRGAYMRRSTWFTHWHAIRTAAGMPGQAFYELRHRAIQWMIDPVDDGGLGLDIQTVAHITGHNDGGYLICSTYTKLTQQRAQARTRAALSAYGHQPRRS
jgi:integrase